MSSITTDEFDGETIGSITTESDSKKKLKVLPPIDLEVKKTLEAELEPNQPTAVPAKDPKPDVSEPVSKPSGYKSLNVKTVNVPKNEGQSELAAMVQKLTGNRFKNTTSQHASQKHNWVPVSKSSEDSETPTESDPVPVIKNIQPVANPVVSNNLPVTVPEVTDMQQKIDLSQPLDINNLTNSVKSCNTQNLSIIPVLPETPNIQVSQEPISNIPGVNEPVCHNLDEPVKNQTINPTLNSIPVGLPPRVPSFTDQIADTKAKTGFRSVRRPITRKSSDLSVTSESESESFRVNRTGSGQLPVPRNYRDIVMSKLAQKRGINVNTDEIENPIMKKIGKPEEIFSDGCQNTSDDAESLPFSYEQEKSQVGNLQENLLEPVEEPVEGVITHNEGPMSNENLENSEISEVSEVPREELKKNLSNHQKVPSKARKPLTRKVSQNIQQIPEEKNDNDENAKSLSDSGRTSPKQELPENDLPKIPEKKKRKKKKLKEPEKPEFIQEKTDLQAEYEEFARQQKEKESQIKEQKKKVKKPKKVEEVKFRLTYYTDR